MATYKEPKLPKGAAQALFAGMTADNDAVTAKPKKKATPAKKPAPKKKK